MILESLITTKDQLGHVNIAPLGPIVYPPQKPDQLPSFLLRPYAGSTTCENLLVNGKGVIHVTDDVLLLAQTAIGRVDTTELVCPAANMSSEFVRLKDCHRWFAVEVQHYGGTPPRHELKAKCVAEGVVPPFFGFNRAKHAVIEAAIMATRIGMIDSQVILRSLGELRIAVTKTAGQDESDAFDLVEAFILERLAQPDAAQVDRASESSVDGLG